MTLQTISIFNISFESSKNNPSLEKIGGKGHHSCLNLSNSPCRNSTLQPHQISTLRLLQSTLDIQLPSPLTSLRATSNLLHTSRPNPRPQYRAVHTHKSALIPSTPSPLPHHHFLPNRPTKEPQRKTYTLACTPLQDPHALEHEPHSAAQPLPRPQRRHHLPQRCAALQPELELRAVGRADDDGGGRVRRSARATYLGGAGESGGSVVSAVARCAGGGAGALACGGVVIVGVVVRVRREAGAGGCAGVVAEVGRAGGEGRTA